jgi:farnesyl-diphosphate farnesyltransferase
MKSNRKKQGAYGKIKTHKESKFSQLCHLDEVFSAISLLYLNPLRSNIDTPYIRSTFNAADLKFCDEILQSVSRSFAAVIRQLPPTMLVDVLVFYLVLRALDTIEDDMNAFSGNEEKIMHLSLFHQTALVDPTWTMDGVGEGDERRLLQNFTHVHSVYASLTLAARDVIGDIAKRMADGMSQYVEKDLGRLQQILSLRCRFGWGGT